MKSPFKGKLLWLLHVQVLLAVSLAIPAFSQGTFQDLNFESPILPLVPVAGAFPTSVYVSNAMPGWTLYIGTNQTPQVLFNDLTLGSASVDLLGPGNTNGGLIIDGSYTAVLQAGVGQNSTEASASIAQTSLVPVTARSLLFEEAGDTYVSASVGGQNIPLYALSTTTNSGFVVTLYGGNISNFAGQTEQLEITSPDTPDEFNGIYIDDIQFSMSSVPEPGTYALLLCGGAVFAFNRWRRRSS